LGFRFRSYSPPPSGFCPSTFRGSSCSFIQEAILRFILDPAPTHFFLVVTPVYRPVCTPYLFFFPWTPLHPPGSLRWLTFVCQYLQLFVPHLCPAVAPLPSIIKTFILLCDDRYGVVSVHNHSGGRYSCRCSSRPVRGRRFPLNNVVRPPPHTNRQARRPPSPSVACACPLVP